jgi:hypothetical protein
MVEAEGDADRMVHDAERYRHSLCKRVDSDSLSLDRYIRASKMLKSSYDGYAASIYEPTVEIKDMDISTDRPALCPSDNAERFRVDGVRPTNGLFQDPRKDDFLLSLSVR